MTDDLRHGGSIGAMRRVFPKAPQPWIDLSTGINPWPYPVRGLPLGAFHALPDAGLTEDARSAMAARWGTRAERIALAAGSEAIIQLLPRLIPARRVGIVGPTYGDHARAWSAAGVKIVDLARVPDHPEDLDVVVVVNPNNPDGRATAPERLLDLGAALTASGGKLIVDEAFADLTPSLSVAHADEPSLVVLRSFGKFFGLAGVRLGAMVAHPTLINACIAAMGSWPVSGPALALASRAYRDTAWIAATRARLAEQAVRRDTVLAASLSLAGGTSLFRLVHHDDAHGLWRHLAEAGIYVRRFEWSTRHLRIGLPATAEALQRLDTALKGFR